MSFRKLVPVGRKVAQLYPPLWPALRLKYLKAKNQLEREYELLPYLVPRGKLAIDVGANTGLYTNALVKLAGEVIAIDPDPDNIRELDRLFGRRIRSYHAAASSSTGTTQLRLPNERSKRGLATIDSENPLSGVEATSLPVNVITLDSLNAETVGFIKIDVEGHELAVLLGARRTLEKSRPVLLIEAENRHRPNAVQSLRDFLEPLGYGGFFLLDDILTAIAKFDPNIHQAVQGLSTDSLNQGNVPENYVTNFIFLPDCRNPG